MYNMSSLQWVFQKRFLPLYRSAGANPVIDS
jgi:hypothetical protein